MKSFRNSLGLLGILAAVASCEQIIGLEDRVLVEDASVEPTTDTQLCKRYCKDVIPACGSTENDAYTSEDNCLSMCSFMPQGKADGTETSKNTASCRANYAHEARDLESDPKLCAAAAPGGGSRSNNPRCGEICEAYCGLHDSICSKQENCFDKCRALPDTGKYSAKTDYMGGDTIQCRVAHLNAAAQAKRDENNDARQLHCGHAQLRASLAPGQPCDLPNGSTPSCKDYCNLIAQSCTDKNKIYDSPEQCEKFCDNGLIKGTNTFEMTSEDGKKMVVEDVNKDTLACRRWHAYFAYGDDMLAADHCKHTGPSGDGHCGESVCKVYCPMLERGCKDQFKKDFPTGQDACVQACKDLPGVKDKDMGYSVAAEEASTNTLQCRFRYLVDVFNGMTNACAQAFPKGTCSK